MDKIDSGTIARATASARSYDIYLDIVLSWFTGRIVSMWHEPASDQYRD